MDIKSLHKEGHSIKAIARHTGRSRNTVRRVLRESAPASFHKPERHSQLDAYKTYLRERWESCGLSAVRLLPEIQAMGYAGSVITLRRFLHSLKPEHERLRKLSVRFETPPGKQAQADWAYCGRFPDPFGHIVPVYLFVMVLSFSRLLYIEFTTSMKLPALLRCHQNAFDFFHGWPLEILYDNMKQVRLSPAELNPLFADFARHYGFAIKTHRIRRPRTKGKVAALAAHLRSTRRSCSARALSGGGTMSVAYEQQASAGLQQLGLAVAAQQLDQAAQQAAASGWSYTHFLGYLLDAELRFRHEKTVRLNLQFANLPYQKRLDSVDFQQQPSIDKRLIEELATGRFLHQGRNMVFLGPPGVGKSHLAIALGVLTAEMGHRIYFTTAIELARRMARAMADNRLAREIKNLTRPKLLIIDEVGYLTLEAAHASLLFQAICERYEKQQSIVLTSNKAFADWSHVFAGDAIMASAALDRLLHRSTVINIRGDSYRLREKRQANALLPKEVSALPAI